MKKSLFIALALAGLSAKAQYFQHLYGYSPEIGTITNNGQVTKAIGPGHLVGAQFIDIAGFPLHQGNYGIYVQRTDPDGRFTTPNDFNKTFLLVNAANNQQLRFTEAQVIEFSDGSGYGAIGSFFEWDPLWLQIIAQGIAYIQLDPNGNVVNVQGYSLGTLTGGQCTVGGMRESVSDPNYLFATGRFTTPHSANNDQMWAMRIDHAGNINWAEIYDFATGYEDVRDIIESPYEEKLIMVGRYYEGPWPSVTFEKGFWMEVNPNTGAFIKLDVVSSFMGAAGEYLNSIDVSNDPSVPGFIMSGTSGPEAWVVKTWNNGGYHWSGLYSSSTNPGKYLRGNDVVGRTNPLTGGGGSDGDAGGGVIVVPGGGTPVPSEYEYYVTGYHWSNPSDGNAYVFKLDRWGNPINPGGMFIYDYGSTELGIDIDVNSSGAGDGISMYAVSNHSQREVYVVKAYFNGVSGCNEQFEELFRRITEYGPVKHLTVSQTPFSYQNISVSTVLNNVDTELCHSTTLASGSNARLANAANEPEATVSPNPMPLEAALATVKVETETAAAVQVTIYDMLGKQYYSGDFTLVKGENSLPVDISNASMTSGLHIVRITGASVNKSMLLIVK